MPSPSLSFISAAFSTSWPYKRSSSPSIAKALTVRMLPMASSHTSVALAIWAWASRDLVLKKAPKKLPIPITDGTMAAVYKVKVGLIQLASECHAWSSKVVKIPLNESVLRYYNVLLSLANAFLGRKNKQLTLPECDMTTCFSEMPTIAFSRTYFWNLSAARRVTVVTFWSPFLSDLFFLHKISFLSLTFFLKNLNVHYYYVVIVAVVVFFTCF